MKFPQIAELESFFHTSYVSTYGHDVSVDYDDLKFVSEFGSNRTVCHIEPAENCFTFAWSQDSVVRLSLAFRDVISLELSSSAGTSRLMGRIKNSESDQLFKLTLFPNVSFELATALPTYD
mgnify:CR=1 FL=1